MNLSREIFNKIGDILLATTAATFESTAAKQNFAWSFETYSANSVETVGGCAHLCDSVHVRALELQKRCVLAVEHGLGYSSDVDLEAYQNGTHADQYHSLDSGIIIPPKPNIGKVFCLTLSWRLEPVCFVYVSIFSDDNVVITDRYKDFVVELDQRIQELGRGWLIGGALPDGYERLGEDDHVAATAIFDGYSLEEKAS